MLPTTNTLPNAHRSCGSVRQALQRELLNLRGEEMVLRDRLTWISNRAGQLQQEIRQLDQPRE